MACRPCTRCWVSRTWAPRQVRAGLPSGLKELDSLTGALQVWLSMRGLLPPRSAECGRVRSRCCHHCCRPCLDPCACLPSPNSLTWAWRTAQCDWVHSSHTRRSPVGSARANGPLQAGANLDREGKSISMVDIVERIIAPTTVLAALAFYFGREFTTHRALAIGFDPSVLGLTNQDYILRSLDALFVPLGALTLTVLVLSLGHGGLQRLDVSSSRGQHVILFLGIALMVAGALFLALGIQGIIGSNPVSSHRWYLLGPLSPGLGMLQLAYGSFLVRRSITGTEAVSRTVVFLVGAFLVLSLFWAASAYAGALGRGRGLQVLANVRSLPATTVMSSQRLLLQGQGIHERRVDVVPATKGPGISVENAGDAFRYQYSGLRLLLRSGGHFFLVPDDYSRTRGRIIMLEESPRVRLEFGQAGG